MAWLGFMVCVGVSVAVGWFFAKRDLLAEGALAICLGWIVVLVSVLLLFGGSSLPDGCYRIITTTSSGVGVGYGSNGSVVVTPIATSGRTYIPIECPR